MILYHFTARRHLPKILAAGYLRTTESNLSARRPHAGPDVVWLTDQPDPDGHGGRILVARIADGSGGFKWWDEMSDSEREHHADVDKTGVRFTVDVSDARHWPGWADRHFITKKWYAELARDAYPDTWYVVERRIPSTEWVEVVDSRTGEDLSTA